MATKQIYLTSSNRAIFVTFADKNLQRFKHKILTPRTQRSQEYWSPSGTRKSYANSRLVFTPHKGTSLVQQVIHSGYISKLNILTVYCTWLRQFEQGVMAGNLKIRLRVPKVLANSSAKRKFIFSKHLLTRPSTKQRKKTQRKTKGKPNFLNAGTSV